MPSSAWLRPLAEAKRLAMGVAGIRGVDFGWGYKEGIRKRRLCIRFHVERKRPESEMAAFEILPKDVKGIPCDVIVASYGLHATPRDAIDPLQPGVSIGNLTRATTGTLGGMVTDATSGQRGLLSNWHVFCGGKAAVVGDPICQPGPAHAGSLPARRVGTLERSLDLAIGCDAAFALSDAGAALDDAVFDLGIRVAGIEKPKLGARLVKAGAISASTSGLIDGIDGAYPVDYTPYGDERRWMDGFRLIHEPGNGPDEISLAGDSGALWINPLTSKAVGLHFAGEDGLGPLAEYALAHPLGKVLELLGVRIP